MKDLSLDSGFSVHLDDHKDLATVEGYDAFEQSVAISLTELMYEDLLGTKASENIVQKIRLRVNRVAREHSLIDDVSSLNVKQGENGGGSYEVEIYYTSGDSSLIPTDITST